MPQVCLAVDLFEVIAELAELDLEESATMAEASTLSEQAQSQLRIGGAPMDRRSDGDEDESARSDSSSVSR